MNHVYSRIVLRATLCATLLSGSAIVVADHAAVAAGGPVDGPAIAAARARPTRTPTATRTPMPTHTPTPTVLPSPTATPTSIPQVCWNVISNPATSLGDETRLSGVSGTGPSDVWAVGYYASNNAWHTLIEHWDGSSWSIIPSPDVITTTGRNAVNVLNAVVAIAPNDAWAVGYDVSLDAPYATLTLHWNGSAWQVVPSPNPPPSPNTLYNALLGVSAVSSNDVWAVGGNPFVSSADDTRGILMHWDGATWQLFPNPPGTASWINTNRTSVKAIASNDVWAAGQYSAFHWNGSAWTVPTGFSGQDIAAIDASASNNVWSDGTHSVPDGNYGFYPSADAQSFNGTTWQSRTPPDFYDSYFKGITVLSPTNVWAVGSNFGKTTLTNQWDGSAWHVVGSANANPNPDINGGNTLQSVTHTSATDLWAVGYYTDNGLSHPRALIEHYVCQ